MGPVFSTEADVGIANRDNPGVADRGAADVGAKIFDDVFARAKWLEIHAPVLLPDGGVDGGQRVLFGQVGEAIAEAGAENAAQCGLGDEEVNISNGDDAPVRGDARAGHDAVDVGVKMQPLVPGVEDHGEAAGLCSKPAGIGVGVAERGRGGAEEAARKKS